MNYFLMSVSILFAVLNNALFHKFANRGLNNTGDIFLFNGGMSAIWSVLLFGLAIVTNTLRFDTTTLIYGAVYGFFLCMFQLFKALALATGPVALTTLISACAFLITTFYTVCFENDRISLGQSIGIIVLLVALVLCIDFSKKSTDAKTRLSGKWLVWSILLFFSGGGVGILYRLFGRSSASANMNSMMLFAALFSALLFTGFGYIINSVRRQPHPRVPRNAILYVAAVGITSCIYIRMNLSLSNLIPGTVFFPVNNGSIVIMSAIIGWVFFGEKLKLKQICGILLGAAAIAVIGIT